MSEPTDINDIDLVDWTAPMTIVDGRTDGVQPHGPGFDDTTHAWQDAEDEPDPVTGQRPWRFAGQTTV
jgi:hypothetical protein